MAIQQIDTDDTFARFTGYYIRKTIIKSTAHAIIEIGGDPEEIATLPEEHYQIYHKSAYNHSDLVSDYDTYEDAVSALRQLAKESESF